MKKQDQLFLVMAHGEPLGIMTMRDALEWSWKQPEGHVTLEFETLEKEVKNG